MSEESITYAVTKGFSKNLWFRPDVEKMLVKPTSDVRATAEVVG